MGVLFRSFFFVLSSYLVEDSGKPRVVPPVHFCKFGLIGRGYPEPLICSTGPSFRVPCHPDFGALFTNRRYCLAPSHLTYRLGLVDPQQSDSGGGLYRFDVSSQPDKGEIDLAVPGPDELLADLVMLRQPWLTLDRRLDLSH